MTQEPTAFTRREFIHTGLVVVSAASTIPGFLMNTAPALGDPAQAKPGVPEDRILVVVQLSGGNDGLNTVVPFGAKAYYDARPALAIAERDAIVLDRNAGIGLHPEMRALADMIQGQQAAIVQGVGYPNPNRSHFASMDIWHTGDALDGKGHGWLGKALDVVAPRQASAMVAIGQESPLAGQGKLTAPVSFENANLFRWAGADLHEALGQQYDKANRAGIVGDHKDDQAAFVMRTALDAQLASDRIRQAVREASLTQFPGHALAQQLRMVAAMIRAELPTRVYYVALGGFDTHAGQPFRQATLLRQFTESLQAFYGELRALRQDARVLTMAFSEFGRRVAQNASQGTDHGTAAPMFLFGPMVRPGLLGQHPSFDQLDAGDLIHTVDFRCIYATILDQWMRADSTRVLGKSFRNAQILRA